MSAALANPVDAVREMLSGERTTRPESSTISGLRTPLGEALTATVYTDAALSNAHVNGRLELADLDRGDHDADLGLVISPTGLAGIDLADAEAWNVSMTLPTLLRILGADTPTEGTPE